MITRNILIDDYALNMIVSASKIVETMLNEEETVSAEVFNEITTYTGVISDIAYRLTSSSDMSADVEELQVIRESILTLYNRFIGLNQVDPKVLRKARFYLRIIQSIAIQLWDEYEWPW